MDALTWSFKKSDGTVSAKLIYECIILASSPPVGSRLLAFVWNNVLPRIFFIFMVGTEKQIVYMG